MWCLPSRSRISSCWSRIRLSCPMLGWQAWINCPQGQMTRTTRPALWSWRPLLCGQARALLRTPGEVPFGACAVCFRPCAPCGPKHCMLCYRRIHPWCATSPYDDAHPIVCSFCASSPSGLTHFQVHNVQMRKHFVISGCATDTAPVVANPPSRCTPRIRTWWLVLSIL